mmetsp:Transcript_14176/g.60674  ORF Transcript_14176/g.60674 Transcript_14176/m.60674 type:complete len:257 (-) Transcript_14176:167-937(-)
MRRRVPPVFVHLRVEVPEHQFNLGGHRGLVASGRPQRLPRRIRHARDDADVLPRPVRAFRAVVLPKHRVVRRVVREHQVRDVHRRAPVDGIADLAAVQDVAHVQRLRVATQRQNLHDVKQRRRARELFAVALVLFPPQPKSPALGVGAPGERRARARVLERDVPPRNHAPRDVSDALVCRLRVLQRDRVRVAQRRGEGASVRRAFRRARVDRVEGIFRVVELLVVARGRHRHGAPERAPGRVVRLGLRPLTRLRAR